MINLFLFYILPLARRQFRSILHGYARRKSKSNFEMNFEEEENQNYGISFFPQSTLIKYSTDDI